MKILIADDNRFSRELIESVLGNYGECRCAEDGASAVQEFEKAIDSREPFSLVCLDIRMPLMDGQQALRKIRFMERERGVGFSEEVPVIMITALDDEEQVSEAFLRGNATSYITKPLTYDKLVEEMTLYGLLC